MSIRHASLLLAALAIATPALAIDQHRLLPDVGLLSEQALDTVVGQIAGKCCMPGRRWGCDPANFNQTGCVPLTQRPHCVKMAWMTMQCTDSTCTAAGPEDICRLIGKTVKQNRCRPTGFITTAGCPVDQWQCRISPSFYTSPDAPSRDAIVCDFGQSTICEYDYSPCD